MTLKLSVRKTDISLPGFTLTATGVSVEGTPNLKQWRTAMQFVHRAGGAVMWWFGDLLVHGEASYGDLEEIDDGKYEKETLYKAKYVAEHVAVCIRMQTLSWGHHQLVAPLPKRDQKRWLSKAEKSGWSVAELRKALRAARLGSAAAFPTDKYRVVYADRLKAGVEVERPIAIGVLKIKAKLGELLPSRQGKRRDLTSGGNLPKFVSTDALKSYRKLATHSDVLDEFIESTEDVPTQTDFLKFCNDAAKLKRKARQRQKENAALRGSDGASWVAAWFSSRVRNVF